MRIGWALAITLAAASPIAAQEIAPPPQQQLGDTLSQGQVRSPILTIDPERLFNESLYGQRVTADVRRDAEALDLENQRIEAALTEEERSLTQLRPSLSVEDFRAAAGAFDEKVQAIREAQDAKERSLQQAISVGKTAFLEASTPFLAQIMIESGAAVILDNRSVFLGVGAVDITDAARTAIDAAIGDGAQLDQVTPDQSDATATPGLDPTLP